MFFIWFIVLNFIFWVPISVSSVVIGKNDEEVDLLVGSRHIMPYNLAEELILDGRVQLI